jgi:hypothetical protein
VTDDLRTVLRTASRQLTEAGVASPQSDAVALLARAWGVESSQVHAAQVLGRGFRCSTSPGSHIFGS